MASYWPEFVKADKIIQKCKLVNCRDKAKEIVKILKRCHDVIAIDVKGNLPEEKIAFVTVGTCDGTVFIFDLWNDQDIMEKGCLCELLQCEKPLKVMFDSKSISQALCKQFNIQIQGVFDCKVAFAYTMKDPQCCKQEPIPEPTLHIIDSCYGRNIGLPTAYSIKRLKCQDSHFWYRRPLCLKVAEYAARQTTCLIPEAYNNLVSGVGCKKRNEMLNDISEAIKCVCGTTELCQQPDQNVKQVLCRHKKQLSCIVMELDEICKCDRKQPPSLLQASKCVSPKCLCGAIRCNCGNDDSCEHIGPNMFDVTYPQKQPCSRLPRCPSPVPSRLMCKRPISPPIALPVADTSCSVDMSAFGIPVCNSAEAYYQEDEQIDDDDDGEADDNEEC